MSIPTTCSISLPHSSTPKLKPKSKIEEEEAEGRAKIVSKYKQKVSTLPTAKGWITDMYNYQGFWYMSLHGAKFEGVMAAHDTFQARPNDIILATNPKSGTTWLKALVFAILNRTKYKTGSTHPLVVGNPHDYIPYIERQLVFRENPVPYGVEISDPQPLATHMPYVTLPQSVHTAGCRVVYICREAKDVFISAWLFLKTIMEMGAEWVSFEEAFDLFCKGVSFTGPYWDHVLGYFKASLECPDKVLFLKYEDMKKDPVSNVKRLAEFMGQPFTADEEEQGVVDEIVELCSFEKMKSLEVNKTGFHRDHFPYNAFFRQGKVGDFVNYLTPEMIEYIDNITKEKFRGYDLSF